MLVPVYSAVSVYVPLLPMFVRMLYCPFLTVVVATVVAPFLMVIVPSFTFLPSLSFTVPVTVTLPA